MSKSHSFDSLFRLEEEHEDNQKREASPLSEKVLRLPEVPMNITHQFTSTSHLPSFHLLDHVQAPIWCLYKTAATVVNMCDFGVCAPPNGPEIAHAIGMFTASWYCAIFCSLVFQCLGVGSENQSRHHSALCFRDPIPCPNTSSCMAIVLSETHSLSSKIPAYPFHTEPTGQQTSLQKLLTSPVGFCQPVNTPLV